MKFKIGDVVVCHDASDGAEMVLKVNKCYKITSVEKDNPSDTYYLVGLDGSKCTAAAYRFTMKTPSAPLFDVDQMLIVVEPPKDGEYHTGHCFKAGDVVFVQKNDIENHNGHYKVRGNSDGESVTQLLMPCQLALSAPTKEKSVIDFTKPLFTAEGSPVTLVTAQGRDSKYPVLAYESTAKTLSKFKLNGEHSSKEARRSLTNEVPPKEHVLYLNVYGGGSSSAYRTRKQADEVANKTRVSCIRVVCAEGQFDE